MLNITDKIIKHKTGLLNLAGEPGNVSKACPVMGYSRDTFHRYKSAIEDGAVEVLFERTRRKPDPANRVDQHMEHVRGAPYHPQTQGRIERWHQTLKNRILQENHHLPSDLRQQIDAFVDHYNHQRYHESLQNLTPADV